MIGKDVYKEFLDSPGEVHALWLGFCSAFIKIHHEKLAEELKRDVYWEYHYYLLGFFIARAFQVVCAFALGVGVCL